MVAFQHKLDRVRPAKRGTTKAFRAATPDRAKNVALEDERLHGEKFPRRRACSASGDDSGGEERKLFAAA